MLCSQFWFNEKNPPKRPKYFRLSLRRQIWMSEHCSPSCFFPLPPPPCPPLPGLYIRLFFFLAFLIFHPHRHLFLLFLFSRVRCLSLFIYIYIYIYATEFICGPPKRVSCVHLRPPKRSFAAPPFRNHCFCSANSVFCGFRVSNQVSSLFSDFSGFSKMPFWRSLRSFFAVQKNFVFFACFCSGVFEAQSKR